MITKTVEKVNMESNRKLYVYLGELDKVIQKPIPSSDSIQIYISDQIEIVTQNEKLKNLLESKENNQIIENIYSIYPGDHAFILISSFILSIVEKSNLEFSVVIMLNLNDLVYDTPALLEISELAKSNKSMGKVLGLEDRVINENIVSCGIPKDIFIASSKVLFEIIQENYIKFDSNLDQALIDLFISGSISYEIVQISNAFKMLRTRELQYFDSLNLFSSQVFTGIGETTLSPKIETNYELKLESKYKRISGLESYLYRKWNKDTRNSIDQFDLKSFQWWLNEEVECYGLKLKRIINEILLNRIDLQNVFIKHDLKLEKKGLESWFSQYGRKELKLKLEYRLTPSSQTLKSGLNLQTLADDKSICVIGYFSRTLGLSESAKSYVLAIKQIYKNVEIIDVPFEMSFIQYQEYRDTIYKGQKRKKYDIGIFVVNSDQITNLLAHPLFDGLIFGKKIGVFAWETNSLVERMKPGIQVVDEIWVQSNFVKKAYALETKIPIKVIGPIIETSELKIYSNTNNEPKLAFYAFDFASDYNRKNPEAIVEAYKLLSENNKNKLKIFIKSINGANFLKDFMKLKELADSQGIIYFDEKWPKKEVSKFLNKVTCIVSPHRAEGFGMFIAEAMVQGKPTLSTNYSGNLDYQNDTNSFLIDYDLVNNEFESSQYPKGVQWAEPNLESIKLGLELVIDGDLNKIGIAASETIQERYSLESQKRIIQVEL
jgi:hypothetical protein